MARGKPNTKSAKPKAAPVIPQSRRGMPAQNSVKDVVDFVSPKGVRYKILKTTETDAYDQTPTASPKNSKEAARKPSSAKNNGSAST